MKEVEEDTASLYAENDFLPINLTSLVIADWDNPKLKEICRRAEVFKAMSGRGTAVFHEGHTYTGTMKNGKMDSTQGTFTWKDGTVYQGRFKKNEISGKGKYTWPDGTTYEGEVLNGIRHGTGIFVNPIEKYEYQGSWKNGLRHGHGVLTFENERDPEAFTGYDGYWEKGEKSGWGKYVYPSQNIFEGEWLNNKRNGKGTMIWVRVKDKPTNEKYVGQWKDDLQSGFGTHIWLDPRSENKILRNRYVGYWKNGMREGHGIFFYANGSMYVGQWKNNMKDGWGKFIFEDGNEFEGYYSKDRIVDKNNENEGKTLTAGIQGASDVTNAQILQKQVEKTIKPVTKIASKKDSKKDSKKETIKPAPSRTKPEIDSNPYGKMIDSSDLLCMEQLRQRILDNPPKKIGMAAGMKPKELQEQINNILLTHNSEMKHWYKLFSSVDSVEFEEGFMMVNRQFWRLLEACYIFKLGFSLAQFHRIYLSGRKTFFSLKYNPFDGIEAKKDTDWRPMTNESEISKKEVLKTEGKDAIEKSEVSPVKPDDIAEHSKITNLIEEGNIQNALSFDLSEEDELQIDEIEGFEKEDAHDPFRPLLFRHFSEAIIRAAYLYYINENISLKHKLSNFFNEKLKPNLPAALARGKNKDFSGLKSSLLFSLEKTLKPFDNLLLRVFKLYSIQGKQKMDRFSDYTIYVKTFLSMVDTVIGPDTLSRETLYEIK